MMWSEMGKKNARERNTKRMIKMHGGPLKTRYALHIMYTKNRESAFQRPGSSLSNKCSH